MNRDELGVVDKMLAELEEPFRCTRCGRDDLPLYLFFEHNQSCAFECATGLTSTMDLAQKNTELNDDVEFLKDRIAKLEMSCRDGLRVIKWFEGILSSRGFDYNARDVAIITNSIAKTLGFAAKVPVLLTDFRCTVCEGVFGQEHAARLNVCRWCHGK